MTSRNINCFNLFLFLCCQLDVNSHAAFITGLEKVSSCPTTRQEWELAERKKNCGGQKIESNITLIYHCLLNHWRDTVYELCGERKVLIGKSYCSMFCVTYVC